MPQPSDPAPCLETLMARSLQTAADRIAIALDGMPADEIAAGSVTLTLPAHELCALSALLSGFGIKPLAHRHGEIDLPPVAPFRASLN